MARQLTPLGRVLVVLAGVSLIGYALSRYGAFASLGGLIEKIVPKAKVVLGPDVSEARIKEMSSAGELAKYRILNFATNGVAFPEAPSL